MFDFSQPAKPVHRVAIAVLLVAVLVGIGKAYYWSALLCVGLAGLIMDVYFALRKP